MHEGLKILIEYPVLRRFSLLRGEKSKIIALRNLLIETQIRVNFKLIKDICDQNHDIETEGRG